LRRTWDKPYPASGWTGRGLRCPPRTSHNETHKLAYPKNKPTSPIHQSKTRRSPCACPRRRLSSDSICGPMR
jgi:hypothetical protein